MRNIRKAEQNCIITHLMNTGIMYRIHSFGIFFFKLKIKEHILAYCKMKSKFKSVHSQIKDLEIQLDLIDKATNNSLDSGKTYLERKLIK